MKKSLGLVKYFPIAARIFSFVMPRLLDFSSYPLHKGKVARLERERQMNIESINFGAAVNNFHKSILSLLTPTHSNYSELKRVGAVRDGGYQIPIIEETKYSWITVGLGFNCHFENEISSLGSKVHTFDHTIPWAPSSLSKHVKWNKIGWGHGDQDSLATIENIRKIADHDLAEGWNLKFDIENAEWSLISQLFHMDGFESLPSIITCELHELLWKPGCEYKLKVLRELRNHYFPIHLHGNNFSAVYATHDYLIYDALELTFIRNDLLEKLTPVSGNGEEPSANDPTSPDFEIRLN
jgi:hypothetical protein